MSPLYNGLFHFVAPIKYFFYRMPNAVFSSPENIQIWFVQRRRRRRFKKSKRLKIFTLKPDNFKFQFFRIKKLYIKFLWSLFKSGKSAFSSCSRVSDSESLGKKSWRGCIEFLLKIYIFGVQKNKFHQEEFHPWLLTFISPECCSPLNWPNGWRILIFSHFN